MSESPILTQLLAELAAYVKDCCTITPSAVQKVDVPHGGGKAGPPEPPDGKLNPGELFHFNVTIKNNGPLTMRNIIMMADATTFAERHYESIEDMAPTSFDLKANASKSIEFWYRAKAVTNGTKVVAKVRLVSWCADLDGPFAGTGKDVETKIEA
ncbi:hypothetical protein [Sorangium sp. So ce1000]|uniref:hypothetical protein n=1 Tax=Sorangium sp. So ce1000 TaxID=3133325 RepID=UPI003F63DCC6